MFEPWETFYLLIGTSAAALVGVMFIVMTLAAEVAVEQFDRGTSLYQTPIVFHLAVIVTVSALAAVPAHLMIVVAGLILLLGLCGIGYSASITQRTLRPDDYYQPTASDRIYFGILPGLSYVLLGAGAVGAWWAPEVAAEAIGGAILLLLLVSIRNAWDVATYTVRLSRLVKDKQRQDE